jgi:hypothetical protein
MGGFWTPERQGVKSTAGCATIGKGKPKKKTDKRTDRSYLYFLFQGVNVYVDFFTTIY